MHGRSLCAIPPFCFLASNHIFKKGRGEGGGLTGSQVLEGSYWERGGDFVQGGVALFM